MNFIESVKVKDGVVMNMEFHLERMKKSIGKLHNTDFTIPEEYRVGVVKMRILYNEETIKDVSFQKYKYPEINSLKMVEGNDICYGLKFEDRTAINNLYLQKEECDDILIIKDGFVTDTSFCNIIFVKNNTYFTPDTPLLEGTKRKFLVENGYITATEIKKNDLKNYQKALLVNAMIDPEDNICIDIDKIL